jgi:hypothetical protein
MCLLLGSSALDALQIERTVRFLSPATGAQRAATQRAAHLCIRCICIRLLFTTRFKAVCAAPLHSGMEGSKPFTQLFASLTLSFFKKKNI